MIYRMPIQESHIVYFAHGKGTGPWGTKITALAQVAREKGFHVESPDYSSILNPDDRVKMLLALKPRATKHLVLVGSSMGGYVSAVASSVLKVSGLFLLAPAFYRPRNYQFQNPKPRAKYVTILHGWNDAVVPVESSIRYAQEYHSDLHILRSDHQMISVLPAIQNLFSLFLDKMRKGKKGATENGNDV